MIYLENHVPVRVGSLKWFWYRIVLSRRLEGVCPECRSFESACECQASLDGSWEDARGEDGNE